MASRIGRSTAAARSEGAGIAVARVGGFSPSSTEARSVSGSLSLAIAAISPLRATIWLFPQYATAPSSLPHLLAATNGTAFS